MPMPTATNTTPPLLYTTRLSRLKSRLQAAAASGGDTDADDDTPLAMLPPSASTAKHTAASAEQTPTDLVRHLPQLTNPASLCHPAASPASTSTPASTSDELTSAAAEEHSTQVKTASLSNTQDAAANTPHLPAFEQPPTDAGCASAAESRSGVTAMTPATALRAVKAVQAVLISTPQPEGCVTEDNHSQSELVGSMQGLQTEQTSSAQAVPSTSDRKAATDSPHPADQQDDLLSDSESEGPPGSPVIQQICSRHTTEAPEDSQDPAGTAALQGQGTPAGPWQQVRSNDEHPQDDVVPSSSNTRLDAHGPVPKGRCPWPQGTESHANMPRQSSTADTAAPDLLRKATTAPVVTLDAGSDATPPTSPGPRLQGPPGLQLGENAAAGVIPVVGSSESLLQAEAEAARLAMLLAPPVYRPPALAHQLAEIGSRLPADNASTGSIQAPLHAQSGAPTESSCPNQKGGDVPSANVQSTACQDGAAEAGPPGVAQHPDVVEGLSTATKLLELPGETRQDLMQQGTSEVVPFIDLQQLATQVNQQGARSDGLVDPGDEMPVTLDKQAHDVSLEEEGADVVIPDR